MDKSTNLLNNKVEYNRCVLPSLQAIGPPPVRTQQEQEPVLRPPLTPGEEEKALSAARTVYRKRVRDSSEERARASKRVKLAWLHTRDTGNHEDGNIKGEPPRQGVKPATKTSYITQYLPAVPKLRGSPVHPAKPGSSTVKHKQMKTTSILEYFKRPDAEAIPDGASTAQKEPSMGPTMSQAEIARAPKPLPSQGSSSLNYVTLCEII